ncbi:MAG: sigma-70 family RNA polymerase sigma factor, partial [Bacteroidales bacterium]
KDIVQEIFFSIWQRSITFNSIPELNHYLYKSVYHNSLKYLRDRKRERFEEVEVESLKFDEGEIIEMALKEEIVRKLEKIIDQLPSRQQKVIKLSLSQMRNIDIADEMKISINTVKKLKKNAYSTIRIHIERDLFLLFLFLLEY